MGCVACRGARCDGLAFGLVFVVANRGGCNGLQYCGCEDLAKYVVKGPTGKASGLAWIHGTLCVCAHHPAIGMSRKDTGHSASFSSSLSRRSGSHKDSAIQARGSRGKAQGVCADWSARVIGLHGSSSTCGVFSPELGGIPGLSGPRCPLWKDDVPCSASEVTFWS